MEIELEKTYLVKELPNLDGCKFVEILDIYIPTSYRHPTLRIRRRGDSYVATKKTMPNKDDASELHEHTIPLSKEEFDELAILKGKRLRKIRYHYPVGQNMAEIDVYQNDLEGLVVADFEFNSVQEKANFTMPDFCLADVTQEEVTAAGFLAGKSYTDIESALNKYNYKKIIK